MTYRRSKAKQRMTSFFFSVSVPDEKKISLKCGRMMNSVYSWQSEKEYNMKRRITETANT
jgi:hypothetical protein